MKIKMFLVSTLLLILNVLNFSVNLAYSENKNLKWFGFYSHPVCGNFKDVKVDEFGPFANVYVELCPDANISDRIAYLKRYDMKVSIALMPLLFQKNNGNWSLRPDYIQKWQDFKAKLKADDLAWIHSFYLFDEPLVHNLPTGDLLAAAKMVKTDFPTIPTLVIESGLPEYIRRFPRLTDIDLVGINIYGIDPFTYEYRTSYNTFKSRLNKNQNIILVADAWWDYEIHNFKNPNDLRADYYRFAHNDTRIVGVFVFIWNLEKKPPFMRSLALRDMADTANSYLGWACQVTKKCKEISNPIKISHVAYLNNEEWSGDITVQCYEANKPAIPQKITVPLSVFYRPDGNRVCYYVKDGPAKSYLVDSYVLRNKYEMIFYYKFAK